MYVLLSPNAYNPSYDVSVLYGTTAFMYTYSVLPSLSSFRSVASFQLNMFIDLYENFISIPANTASDAFPRALRSPTLDLASNHLVCSVALTGVLILQASRWWAELSDGDDEPYLEEKNAETTAEAESAAPSGTKSVLTP